MFGLESLFGKKKVSQQEINEQKDHETALHEDELRESIKEKTAEYNKRMTEGTLPDMGRAEYDVEHVNDVASLSVEDREVFKNKSVEIEYDPNNSADAMEIKNNANDAYNNETLSPGDMKAMAKEGVSSSEFDSPIEPPSHWNSEKANTEKLVKEFEELDIEDKDYPPVEKFEEDDSSMKEVA